MAKEIVILDVKKFMSTDPARVGKLDTFVIYSVDKDRKAFVAIRKDAPTDAEIKAAIAADEKARAANVGKTFSIE
jgi:hypothetical protein